MPYTTPALSLPNLILYAENQDRMNMEAREIRMKALRLARERERIFAHHAYPPISTPPHRNDMGHRPRGYELPDAEYEELFGPRPTRWPSRVTNEEFEAVFGPWGRGPSWVTNEEVESVFGHRSVPAENPYIPDPRSLNPRVYSSPDIHRYISHIGSSGFDVNPIEAMPWSHNE